MKKKNYCTEDKRVVYMNTKTNVAHCILDCTVDLAPEDDDNIPWNLSQALRDKYSAVLEHQFGSVFKVHIETQAACQGGDSFDEKKGKTVAYSKAQLKLYNLLERVFEDMKVFLTKQAIEYTAVQEMFERYKKREENFVSSI